MKFLCVPQYLSILTASFIQYFAAMLLFYTNLYFLLYIIICDMSHVLEINYQLILSYNNACRNSVSDHVLDLHTRGVQLNIDYTSTISASRNKQNNQITLMGKLAVYAKYYII